MIVSAGAKPARTVLIGSAEEVRPPSAKADLLNKAASKIDTGENDIDLAAALMECADRFGRRRRVTTRHMREVALRLVMIS